MEDFITLKIRLGKDEWFALRDNAKQDYREPAAQVRHLLREILLSPEKHNDLNAQLLTAGVKVIGVCSHS